ncbi:MAG: hypothetical protein ACR2HJ_07140 [Fimbriimonadales bacterium]
MRRVAGFVLFGLFGVGLAQYKVEVLHPDGVGPRSFGMGAGGGQQVGHTNLFQIGPSHALLWSGSQESFIYLHPAGWDGSYAMGVSGGKQIGYRERSSGQGRGQFATLWSGSAKSWVDLHDDRYIETNGLGIGGDQQVGFGAINQEDVHAPMWLGTAKSLVSLHPGNEFEASRAYDTDGKQQVGGAATRVFSHAALWTGTAESYVDLGPKGYGTSVAHGVAKGQQAGWAAFDGNAHAGIWRGTAESFVDLNPGPNDQVGSIAFATNGETQVGVAAGLLIGGFHASLWHGSPETFPDLHTFLPERFQGKGAESEARGIDEFGHIVGWARDTNTQAAQAILWTPVPEPASGTILLTSLVLLLARRSGGTQTKTP